MKMTDKQKKYWAVNALSIFKTDKKLSLRVKATWPLYGLRWVLIILKDVLKYNKILLSGKKTELNKIENLLQKQLTKSSFIINKISNNNFICPYV